MKIEVDPVFREVIIDGQKFSYEIFEFICSAAVPTKWFRIVSRAPDARIDVNTSEALTDKIVNQVLFELEELCKFEVEEWRESLKKAIERGLE